MRKAITGALLVLALAIMAPAANGQFFPMSFGFPNAVHYATATAWEQDTANVFDFQDTSIVPAGWFPAIHQTSIHTQSMSHTEFSQTSEYTAIGYPYTSMRPFGCGY